MIKAFGKAVGTLFQRPAILIFYGVLTAVWFLLDSYNPVSSLVFGLVRMTGGSFFDQFISALQMLMEPRIALAILALLLILSAVLAVLAGFLLSGYLNSINKALNGFARTSGNFSEGVKKYFTKVLWISFIAVFFGSLLAIFMAVASVPAVIITHAVLSGRTDFALAAVFLDLLTVVVLFFVLLFFRGYVFFWYPAALNGEKRPFRQSRQIVDRHFWKVLLSFAVFDAVFIASLYVCGTIRHPTAAVILTGVFITLFLSIFTMYIFSLYKEWKPVNHQ